MLASTTYIEDSEKISKEIISREDRNGDLWGSNLIGRLVDLHQASQVNVCIFHKGHPWILFASLYQLHLEWEWAFIDHWNQSWYLEINHLFNWKIFSDQGNCTTVNGYPHIHLQINLDYYHWKNSTTNFSPNKFIDYWEGGHSKTEAHLSIPKSENTYHLKWLVFTYQY